MGCKMVYKFLGKDEKNKKISTYFFFSLKHRCGKKLDIFSVRCILTKTMLLPTPLVSPNEQHLCVKLWLSSYSLV